jgi:hypothetical protein
MTLMRPTMPSTSGGTYRQSRRDSLNFESLGGERHSPYDACLEPFGRIYHFLATTAGKVGARVN